MTIRKLFIEFENKVQSYINDNDLEYFQNDLEVLEIKINNFIKEMGNKHINKKTSDNFNELWAKYPRKEGKKEALRHYNASIRKDKEAHRKISIAIDVYLDLIKGKEKQYIKQGSTFFNNWQDYYEMHTAERPAERRTFPSKYRN